MSLLPRFAYLSPFALLSLPGLEKHNTLPFLPDECNVAVLTVGGHIPIHNCCPTAP